MQDFFDFERMFPRKKADNFRLVQARSTRDFELGRNLEQAGFFSQPSTAFLFAILTSCKLGRAEIILLFF